MSNLVVLYDFEIRKIGKVKELAKFPALTIFHDFENIKSQAESLNADFLVWFGGYWVAYKSIL